MAEKILIVDDEVESLKLIGLLLHRQAYETLAASNGVQALELAARETPDLVLLDVMMPNMDGYEVCRRLRGNPALAHIPIIMFTAKTQIDDKVAGFEAGADDYLTKPIHPAELTSRVRAMLSRSKVARAPATTKRARVIAFLGAKGGVGTTSSALNTAILLAQGQHEVVLVEFRPGAGTAGLQLGFSRPTGMGILMSQADKTLDGAAISAQLLQHKTGLKLLPSSYNARESLEVLSADQAEKIVRHLAQSADFVVVDLGCGLSPVVQRVAQIADQVLLCVEPQRVCVTVAMALLSELEKSGLGEGRLQVMLVNKSRSGMSIAFQSVESILQRKIMVVMTPAPELAFQAAEAGTPMVLLQPESVTADQFRTLCEHLVAHSRPTKATGTLAAI